MSGIEGDVFRFLEASIRGASRDRGIACGQHESRRMRHVLLLGDLASAIYGSSAAVDREVK